MDCLRDPSSLTIIDISAFFGFIFFPFVDSCHRYRSKADVEDDRAFVIHRIRRLCICVYLCVLVCVHVMDPTAVSYKSHL